MSAPVVTVTGTLPSGMTRSGVVALATATCAAARAAGNRLAKNPGAISVRVTGDAEVRKLNRIHRHMDKVTDVLSFGYDAVPGAGEQPLGDIVIALPQVRRQAKQIGRSAKAEFSLMVVHGTLHLLGFDHESLADETRMFRLQHDILIRAGIF